MGKRRTSPAEDLLDLVASLPWWAGVLLAAISFIILDRLSVPPAAQVGPGQMGAFVQRSMVAALANAGRLVVPVLCLAAAAVSFARRRKRIGLHREAQLGGAGAIARMSWREFEALVGEVFRQRGFAVRENFEGGADGGVDLVLEKNGQLTFVQCKHWKTQRVGVSVVRELFGVMSARGASAGVLVTSGIFTTEAKGFAEQTAISLWDGTVLSANLSPLAKLSPRVQSPAAPAAIDCPRCGSAMVKRVAKAGANAGKPFWGCSRFPECRGIRSLG